MSRGAVRRTTLGAVIAWLIAILDAGVATRATLMLTHLVAAAIVIPALCKCMPNLRSEATMAR